MSSTESSGAPAEATATTPAQDAAFPSFGSTRGSGLARGKGKRASAPAAATAASSAYTPTAIEVINAPREYTNPFAPVETPAAVTEPAVAPVAPAPVAPIKQYSAPASPEPARGERAESVARAEPEQIVDELTDEDLEPESVENDEPAELNILEPEQQKSAPAQTWESEGFRPAREQRSERPRREESRRDEPRRDERPAEAFDPASIPEKFLYVRPGHTYVPTPTNYGGAPRERHSAPREAYAPAATSSASAPQKSGGFLGWLKSLFGGSPAPAPVTASAHDGEARREGGEHRRHRGGRNRGGQGGGQGRSRGGRGRSGGGGGNYRSEGSSQGGI
jgi:uncharacterized membrane protein YgcG